METVNRPRKLWIIEARAHKSTSLNYWRPYAMRDTRRSALSDMQALRIDQAWVLWRVRAYLPAINGAERA